MLSRPRQCFHGCLSTPSFLAVNTHWRSQTAPRLLSSGNVKTKPASARQHCGCVYASSKQTGSQPGSAVTGAAASALSALEICVMVGSIYATVILLQQQRAAQIAAPAATSAALCTGTDIVQLTHSATDETVAACSRMDPRWSGLMTLQGSLVLAALICGRMASALRSRPMSSVSSPQASADAAARLARLEILVSEQRAALQASQQHVAKARLRYELYTSEVKKPMQQIQGSLEQQAEVLTKLAAAQQQLKQQIEGNEQVIMALQGVAAKQFQVTVDAITRLQQEQAAMKQAVAAACASATASSTARPLEIRSAGLPPDPWV